MPVPISDTGPGAGKHHRAVQFTVGILLTGTGPGRPGTGTGLLLLKVVDWGMESSRALD